MGSMLADHQVIFCGAGHHEETSGFYSDPGRLPAYGACPIATKYVDVSSKICICLSVLPTSL